MGVGQLSTNQPDSIEFRIFNWDGNEIIPIVVCSPACEEILDIASDLFMIEFTFFTFEKSKYALSQYRSNYETHTDNHGNGETAQSGKYIQLC